MNKFIFFSIILIGFNLLSAQVGIGTETPDAMLDVAGTLRVQDSTAMEGSLRLEYIEDLEIMDLQEMKSF